MIQREMAPELIQVANEYPVVTILGPRQSGKTTLAKMTFPDYDYCSLEEPDVRNFASTDPRAFLAQYQKDVIFDEIQRVPTLLSYIQTLVDEHNFKGRFILTGSHQLELRAEISQSLAGRTAILSLLPLSISEVKTIKQFENKDDYIFNGFFPRIYNDHLNPTRAYSNYYKTYIERDVRQLINLKDVSQFEKFLRLMAGRVGQVLNLSSLSNDVGASSTTLKEWLSILEASFIVYKLLPYFENFGKRVIKSPKYYFTDVGLLSYLLGIDKKEQVLRDPLIGNIFENLVVIECLKNRYNQGKESNLYFFRDSNGNEVDLLLDNARKLTPVEIKSSSTFNINFTKGIKKLQGITANCTQGYVVYAGDFFPVTEEYRTIHFTAVNSLGRDFGSEVR
ncbi:MAG: ATP-binding protein [Myxococcota bacterium]|nr:ATP-binding protein [Myxococcota bacterium]